VNWSIESSEPKRRNPEDNARPVAGANLFCQPLKTLRRIDSTGVSGFRAKPKLMELSVVILEAALVSQSPPRKRHYCKKLDD
jgi:hypothetical protein